MPADPEAGEHQRAPARSTPSGAVPTVAGVGLEIGWVDQDVVSPELVLVSSPEDARSAREGLPDLPWLMPPSSPATSASTLDGDTLARIDRPPQPPRYLRVIAGEHSQPPPHRLRPLVLAISLATALFAAGYLTEQYLLGRGTNQPVAGPSTPAGSTALQNVGTKTMREQTTPITSNGVADHGAPRSSSSSGAISPGELVPSRTWGWAPQPGADAYEVTFYRNGRVVLHARSKDHRLVLPRRFQFRAGRYRWTVHPVRSGTGEPPIADSSFSLTPAEAAAANK
jgi:hypothetical protein